MTKLSLSRRVLSRRGLTLLELVVVLVILIGLAGIVVPMLPSMLGRTETSSGATNHTEISKWVQTYEQIYLGYPKDWDSLTDIGGTKKITYVRGGGGIVLDSGLTAGEADALNGAGITRLQAMVEAPTGIAPPPPNNKTFDPYTDPSYDTNKIKPAAGTKLVILTKEGQQSLGLSDGTDSPAKYVVFGFGNRASIIGKTTQNAPVVFRDDGSKTPDQVYCRYGVVFQVTNADGTTLERARFVGTCNFKGPGVFNSDADLEEFYDLNKGGA